MTCAAPAGLATVPGGSTPKGMKAGAVIEFWVPPSAAASRNDATVTFTWSVSPAIYMTSCLNFWLVSSTGNVLAHADNPKETAGEFVWSLGLSTPHKLYVTSDFELSGTKMLQVLSYRMTGACTTSPTGATAPPPAIKPPPAVAPTLTSYPGFAAVTSGAEALAVAQAGMPLYVRSSAGVFTRYTGGVGGIQNAITLGWATHAVQLYISTSAVPPQNPPVVVPPPTVKPASTSGMWVVAGLGIAGVFVWMHSRNKGPVVAPAGAGHPETARATRAA